METFLFWVAAIAGGVALGNVAPRLLPALWQRVSALRAPSWAKPRRLAWIAVILVVVGALTFAVAAELDRQEAGREYLRFLERQRRDSINRLGPIFTTP